MGKEREKGYRLRRKHADGIPRAGVGVFVVLAKNQVDALVALADSTDKSLKQYLTDIAQSMIDQMIPPSVSTLS